MDGMQDLSPTITLSDEHGHDDSSGESVLYLKTLVFMWVG